LAVMVGIAVIAVVALALPAWSHHAHGNYTTETKDFEGIVTEVHALNPHSWVYVNVTDESGKEQMWAMEGGGSRGLAELAKEGKQFRSNEDHFTANFPGNPTVTDTVWESEYGAYLPAHIYTAKQGPGTYSMTVVDYNLAKMLDTQNAKRCPPALERCDGLTSF